MVNPHVVYSRFKRGQRLADGSSAPFYERVRVTTLISDDGVAALFDYLPDREIARGSILKIPVHQHVLDNLVQRGPIAVFTSAWPLIKVTLLDSHFFIIFLLTAAPKLA